MSKLHFLNNGEFDVVSMMTFGISAKANDDAIGYFGTGFKYAIAIILRLGGSITIKTGGEEFAFTCEKKSVRGKDFQIVLLNGQNAGFTTHLGINWEPWMAYRELYCNCMDEGGVVEYEHKEGYDTEIIVDCGPILQARANHSFYFISTPAIYESHSVSIHEGQSQFVFYKGVAVYEKTTYSPYTYNVKKAISLTEDRTSKNPYEIYWALQQTLQNCSNKDIISNVLSPKSKFENNIGFSTQFLVSQEFIDVAKSMVKTKGGISSSVSAILKKYCNTSALPEVELSNVQKKMLEKAKVFLDKIGIYVDDFPLKIVSGLGEGVMGEAKDGNIYLSEIPFQLGTKQVASTLMEEWVHLTYGCADFDRDMQNWLFDKILSIGEELNGEPL